MFKKVNVFVCFAMINCVVSFAQTTIKSVVKSSEDHQVISGALVTDLSTNQTTITNSKGEFSLEAKGDIEVSSYGFETISINPKEVKETIL